MFTSLHALAQQATLMITIAPEGADQLRVNVMPLPADAKAKAGLPAPLSLVATPAEFDTDFAVALSTWQSPKRSLIQQAQDAAGSAAKADAPALPAPKPAGKTEKAAGKKGRGGKGGADQEPAAQDAAADAGEAALVDDQVPGEAGDQQAATDQAADAQQPADVGAQNIERNAAQAAQVVADFASTPATGDVATPSADDVPHDMDTGAEASGGDFTLDLF